MKKLVEVTGKRTLFNNDLFDQWYCDNCKFYGGRCMGMPFKVVAGKCSLYDKMENGLPIEKPSWWREGGELPE